jgi:hypothetical protein
MSHRNSIGDVVIDTDFIFSLKIASIPSDKTNYVDIESRI